MARLIWDKVGERFYETGVKHGVFYPINGRGKYWNGVAWNGLTQVTEKPTGAEPTALYADDLKYLNLLSMEEFGATIEAYSYPLEFARALGRIEIARGVEIAQQERTRFGFSYQTTAGNDTEGTEYAYKIHLIYGAKASPSEESFSTIDDSPDAVTYSWDIATEPIAVENGKPTAHVILDGMLFKQKGLMNALHAIEDVLYGTDDASAKMPFPDEIQEKVIEHKYLRDSNGDIVYDRNGNPVESSVYH